MPPPLPPSSALPLVGRDRELVALRDALAAAQAGRGSLVLIGGEAGIGKTALAEATLGEASARGALILIGRCYDLIETPPYGPWAEALERAPRGGGLPVLPAAVLPPDQEGEALASQQAIIARARGYLAALADQRPLVLLLDDLHWADPASLDLLRAVARGLAALPLLVIATYRAEEVARDHPLYALLPLLVREARAVRLDVRPLNGDDLAALVQAHQGLSAWDEARLVAHLGERAAGNPFFAGEVLRALREEGVLRPPADGDTPGRWSLGPLTAVPVPALLQQVIDGRATRLGERAHHLLGLAATIGQRVPLWLWRATGDADEEGLAEVVERAVAAGIVAEDPDGQAVRFAHALIREALYAGVPLPRRQGWHRRVADALLAAPAPDPDAVAYHLGRAGDPRAATWLAAAGDRARRARALVMAGERYGTALALLEAAGAPAGERAWVAYRAAQGLAVSDPEASVRSFERASALAAEAGDRGLAAGATFQSGLILGTVRQMRRGLDAMGAALPVLDTLSPDEHARLWLGDANSGGQYAPHGALAEALAATGRFGEALALATRLAPAGEPGTPPGDPAPGSAAGAYRALAIAHAGLGHPEEARRASAAARARSRAVGDDHQLGLLAREGLSWIALPYRADHLDERRALAEEGQAAWQRARGTHGTIPPGSAVTLLLLVEARWDEVRAIAEEVRAGGNPGPARMVASFVLATIAREAGDLDAAWALATESLPPPEADPGDTYLLNTLPVQRLAALVALDRGDLPAARAWLACHDRWLAWSGAVPGRSEGAALWARLHRQVGEATQARAHAERALTEADAPRQPLALLAAHRLLAEFAAAGQHDEARTHLGAALALAEACAAPYEHALTLLALAELDADAGDRPSAETALESARAIIEPMGARPALARAAALAQRLAAPPDETLPAGLSAREAEVLGLVARGLSTADVAARLFLSPRTVNTHLTNIYTKLGITSRTAATRFAIEHGLA